MISYLNSFKITTLFEGVSFILFLIMASPINGMLDTPHLAIPHGLLFLLFTNLYFALKIDKDWNLKTCSIIRLTAVNPLETTKLTQNI